MNEPNDMAIIVSNMTTRDRSPTLKFLRATEKYNVSEIYDDPIEHMTTRGILRYVGIDIIET